MRAKRINEATNFERGKRPVGRQSLEGKERMLKNLEEKLGGSGILFRSSEIRSGFLENIEEYDEVINQLIDKGVDPKRIDIWEDLIAIKPVQVLDFNYVIAEFFTDDDADEMIKFMKKHTIKKSSVFSKSIASMPNSYRVEELKEIIKRRWGN